MANLFRFIFLAACAGGGVWGAFRLLDHLVQQAGGHAEIDLMNGGVLLLIPVGIVGALAGALMGGLLLPRPR